MPKEIRTPVTAMQLRGVAKHIEETAAAIRRQADIVEEEGFEPFQVTTWGQTNRGLGFLDSFISAIRDSLKYERQERGDMPAVPEPAKNAQADAPKKPRPKKSEK